MNTIRKGDYLHTVDISGIIVSVEHDRVMLMDDNGQVEIVNIDEIVIISTRVGDGAADYATLAKKEQLINAGLLEVSVYTVMLFTEKYSTVYHSWAICEGEAISQALEWATNDEHGPIELSIATPGFWIGDREIVQ